MRKYVVGITGGIATGKTNVTDTLKKAGAHVVDADEVSRALTKDGGTALESIRAHFGDGVFSQTAPVLKLDRKKLGSVIFTDAEKKQLLESLLHPLIIGCCRQEVLSSPDPIVFLSAPLLYECGMEKMCDEVWCTYLPEDMQLARLMERDRSTEEEARMRMQSQMPAREKRDRAQFIILTQGTREESAEKALRAYSELKQRIQ